MGEQQLLLLSSVVSLLVLFSLTRVSGGVMVNNISIIYYIEQDMRTRDEGGLEFRGTLVYENL